MAKEQDGAGDGRRIVAHSALLWGGVSFGPDGRTEVIPEAEALAVAIGAWVNDPDMLEDAVRVYLTAIKRPEPFVRRAVLEAVEAIAQRYQRMPQRSAVTAAARDATSDEDATVRAAAVSALHALGGA